uniref:Putative secreted protein n=1 Tax=Ixodes ricinus TaxID=34613 RepID=A0A6B0UCE2_IXORI
MLLFLAKMANASLVNCVPLSVTIVRETPNLAKMLRKLAIVDDVLACLMGTASIHLVAASTTTSIMLPATGPAKSAWSLDHFSLTAGQLMG